MPDANEQEITNLIKAAGDGAVDMAIVGSETLLRGDLTAAQLISYLDRVRAAIPPAIPVTTADTCDQLLRTPQVVAHTDAIFVNDYPYFAGVPVNCGIAALHYCYQQLTAVAGGRPVIISESGWPSCGDTRNQAVPSPENASFYFLNLVSWARANNVPFFYFEAFDEPWKAKYEGTIGACWGVWNKDGKLKPGMERVFEDQTIPDNWSDPVVTGCDVAGSSVVVGSTKEAMKHNARS
jgi:exo-beta-1,3-glucanase (GH17 family)